jgi:hypothetical protein
MKIIVNDKVGRIVKKATVANFKVISQRLLDLLKETMKNRAESRTQGFPNKNLDHSVGFVLDQTYIIILTWEESFWHETFAKFIGL